MSLSLSVIDFDNHFQYLSKSELSFSLKIFKKAKCPTFRLQPYYIQFVSSPSSPELILSCKNSNQHALQKVCLQDKENSVASVSSS